MNKNTSIAIKGIVSIAIILYHIDYNNVVNNALFECFGYLGVGVFFLISGYNLAYCNCNKENYIDSFLYKKTFLLFLPFYVWSTVYLFFLGEKIGLKTFICFLDPTYNCYYAWYVKRLIYIYIIYYITKKYSLLNWEKRSVSGIILLVISGILYLPADHDPNHTFPIAFLFGWLLGSEQKDTIKKIGENNKILIGSIVLFLATIIRVYYPNGHLVQYVFSSYFSPALVGIIVFFICVKINVKNKLLIGLGKISYGIFLIHPCFIEIGNNINNIYLYCLVVFVGTIVVSYISTVFFDKILFKRVEKRLTSK